MIRRFTPADVGAAAGLLAARHDLHRQASPLLRPLDAAQAAGAIGALLAADGTSGYVAERGGEVVGYLLGTPRDGASWGASTWVEPAGCAGEQLPELWAAAAAGWVAAGRTAQYVIVPPSLAPTFFSLGFGLQHVHAAMPVPAGARVPDRVRTAERSDIPVLARLDLVLSEHLAASPVLSSAEVPSYAEAVQEWENDFDDPGFAVYVVEQDGAVVGSAVGCDVGKSTGNAGLIVPERAALLGFVAVLPEARGRGLGRVLADAVSGWARQQDYEVICTDWRATNLTAARTWPAVGYAPTFLRLHRLIGH